MSVNITKVYLLNIPLEDDYKHTFYFNSKSEQESYFKSKLVNANNYAEYSDFSYQRKDSKMRIPVPYDEALKFNYVMYQNTAYSSKWFYAFIKDYEFRNDEITEITLETDVIQTWLFDYTVKPSFVEREHVNDDTIGINTVPENLEMGEYYCHSMFRDSQSTSLAVVIGVSEKPDGTLRCSLYDGIPSGIIYYAFKYDKAIGEGYKNTTLQKIVEFIVKYTGRTEAITTMFLYPYELLTINESETDYGSVLVDMVYPSSTPQTYNIEMSKDSVYSFYFNDNNSKYEISKPKNNKLLTYPFMYMIASNNNGGSAIYEYEHFKDSNIDFKVYGCITPGGSIRMVPLNYKGLAENQEEGLNLGKFPICNWTSDVFTNWLTQNSLNIGLSTITGLGQIVGGTATAIATGGAMGVGTAIGGVGSIAGQLGQMHQMYMTPSQAQGNVNCGDVITVSDNNKFTFYNMRIKPEYMKIIDEYFSSFGYKVNRIKVPLKNHRQNWWFTKTIDVNIQGAIPKADLQQIKNCYNNGITFWKNTANFKNYDIDNPII